MTSDGYVAVGVFALLYGAFFVGLLVGHAEARAGWWERRREMLRRVYGSDLRDDDGRRPW